MKFSLRPVNEYFKEFVRIITKEGIRILSKIMGIVILLYSVQLVYVNDAGVTDYGLEMYIGVAVMIVCSVLILIDFGCNLNRTVGLYALGLGINRVIKYSSYIFNKNGFMELFGIVMTAVAINFIYTATCFLRGTTRGRFNMILTSTFMALVSFVTIIVSVREGGMTVEEVFNKSPDTFMLILMYILLIGMLTSNDIRESDLNQIYMHKLESIRLTESCDRNSCITAGTADVLARAFTDRSDWKRVDEGPVECEYDFHIMHGIYDVSFVCVQKWKGHDELFFTVSDRKDSTFLNSYRFSADRILIDDSNDLLIFGSDGTRARLHIGEEVVKRKPKKPQETT